jgi:hypothetical protein
VHIRPNGRLLRERRSLPLSNSFLLYNWIEENAAYSGDKKSDRTKFTPLENYIAHCGKDTYRNIIAYLKSETDTLLLTDINYKLFIDYHLF